MAGLDVIETPKLVFIEGAAPGTPAAGIVYIYAKADGLLYSKDDAGTETVVSGGGSLADHNHTTGGDGGDLDAPIIDSHAVFNEEAAPSTPASGTVALYAKSDGLFYSKDDAGTETVVSGGGGGTTMVGQLPFAAPQGWSNELLTASNTTLAATSGANSGALAVPIIVSGPMSAEGVAMINGDTATARSCEFRLYLDGGDSTADFVTGTDGTLSFTPSAASIRRASFSAAPVTLSPGTYWLVVRNTHATSTFAIRRGSGTFAAMYACQTHTGIATLGASIELRTSWTSNISVPHTWVDGRVLGLTAALT